jgi:hypothetical protein
LAADGIGVVAAEESLAVGEHVLVQALGFSVPALDCDHFREAVSAV